MAGRSPTTAARMAGVSSMCDAGNATSRQQRAAGTRIQTSSGGWVETLVVRPSLYRGNEPTPAGAQALERRRVIKPDGYAVDTAYPIWHQSIKLVPVPLPPSHSISIVGLTLNSDIVLQSPLKANPPEDGPPTIETPDQRTEGLSDETTTHEGTETRGGDSATASIYHA